MKQISLMGSTGSIGTQSLEVIRRNPGLFRVCALTAGKNVDLLERQVREFLPPLAVLQSKEDALLLQSRLAGLGTRVLWGEEGLREAAAWPQADLVLNALVGIAGLGPTLAALDAGHTLALANKESLVCAGALVMERARKKGCAILPVDSEHSAIYQALGGRPNDEIHRVLLTASGGPFFNHSPQQLAQVTAADALKHPNWAMGSKITIDSATMMNKGFEVIEALWLFDLQPQQVEVLVHAESILHSAVEFGDHSVIAQLSPPDMRLPIQYALTAPERLAATWPPLDLFALGKLTFCPPDREKFPCLALCEQAGRDGGDRGVVINAANEVAVAAFLQGGIGYQDIYRLVAQALESEHQAKLCSTEQVFATDDRVRRQTAQRIKAL